MSSGAFAVWNRAQARAALAAGEDRLQLFRRFDAECDALGLTYAAREAAEECLRLRTKIDAGDGGAVLDAVGHCAEHQLVIPEWLADEYLRRHGAVGRGRAKDWNDEQAFGRAYPKGTNIAGVRARVEDAPAAYMVAAKLLAEDPARPFDAGFYEDVGARVGVGKTRAQELLAMAMKDERYAWPTLAQLRAKLTAGLDLAASFRELSDERTHAWLGSVDTGK
jgi:hypothetical protein